MSTPVDTDNLNMLKELIGDDLKEILQAYLDSAPDLIGNIDHALSTTNQEQLRLHSHSLKGSSANIGAHNLSSYCAKLEQLAKNNDIGAEATSIFSTIKQENTIVEQFLQNFMNQM